MVVKILKKGNSIKEEKLVPKVSKTFTFIQKKKPLSMRDQIVVKEVAKGGKSKAKILRKAGYSEKVARNPKMVFDKPEVNEAIIPIVSRMEKVREKILKALEGKDMTKQSPFNLTAMMNMHTKDIELLSGRPTDRSAYELPEEEKARLRKLLEKNKKK